MLSLAVSVGLAADLVLSGESARANFGSTLAGPGDFDGDGYADVVVGARGQDSYLGRVYSFPGGPDGPSPAPAWTYSGTEAYDTVAWALAFAGDVNGDGDDELAVSLQNGGDYGEVLLFAGPDAAPALSLTDPDGSSSFGETVNGVGDTDGDGLADLLVSAPTVRVDDHYGVAYLYRGDATGLDLEPAAFTGDTDVVYFCIFASGAGDIDADGYADFACGASPASGDAAHVFVFHGAADRPSLAAELWPAEGVSGFGSGLTGGGDLDGDGFDDLAVYGGTPELGSFLAVHRGSAAGASATASQYVSGVDPTDSFASGYAMAELTGDAYADLLVGASWADDGVGAAELYAGSADGVEATPKLDLAGRGSATLYGDAVAAVGDLDGDGRGDFVVGAPNEDGAAGTATVWWWGKDPDPDTGDTGPGDSGDTGPADTGDSGPGDTAVTDSEPPTDTSPAADDSGTPKDDPDGDPACGCAAGPAGPGALGVLAALLLVRRRR